ncbi:MAG TPA: tRNA lysidine(34) synthetase TilS [Candidatus Acidoferrum sp.]|nr:tRNA lysidine(34) synthetase TilS [Candidatus Acidoferrum sp.]
MLRAGERVGVGVSGGADSVALLMLLLELRERMGIVVSVAHLNHKLRAKASEADEKFVAGLAATHGLVFHAENVNVAARAKREKANLEDAGRRARYEFFAKLVAEGKVDRVAVAHTADDQAETILAHILRGTGLAGLGGIHPQTESVVRPLLGIRRAELRTYLRAKKQRWHEDATNRDTTRTRARIRKKLLPLLEREFQNGVVEHLSSLAELAREDEELLELLARKHCEALARSTNVETRISVSDLLLPVGKGDFNTEGAEDTEKKNKTSALTKRMLRRLIEERKSGTGQITALHIAAVLDLARLGENGKEVQLPGGVDVRRERNELVFCTNTQRPVRRNSSDRGAEKSSAAKYEHKIDFSNADVVLRVPQAQCVFRLRVIDWPAERVETSELGAVLDRDRLRSPLVLRNWRFGDKLQPEGHQKAHKLKRLLNEKRVSRWEREGWPVLTSGGILVWARGFPVAAAYAANEGTRTGILIAEEKS